MISQVVSRVRPALAILFGFLLGVTPVAAQSLAAQSYAVQSAAPADDLTVVLLTFGAGDQVWEKFGHNALWVHDPQGGTDYVYNWGVFDFNSPGYWSRFVKGTWIYQIAAADIQQTLALYQYLNRTVTAQELNLTQAQSMELKEFLEWNMLPQNREYLYDYYRDNCSTRVRDALDGVLDGRLRATTLDVPTGTTFRSHTRRLVASDPVIYTALEAGLGPAADRPISAWEEMFLPEKVEQRVREVKVTTQDGELVPLVRSERVLYAAVGRPPERTRPPRWIPRFLLLGIAVAAVLTALGHAARRGALARFGFSIVAVLWTLLVGSGGIILIGIWAFTNHSIAYANENILQFTPLALPLVVLLPALAYRVRWAARWARWLAVAAACSSLLGFALQIFPGFDQVNGEIIAMLLPANLAIAWIAFRLGDA